MVEGKRKKEEEGEQEEEKERKKRKEQGGEERKIPSNPSLLLGGQLWPYQHVCCTGTKVQIMSYGRAWPGIVPIPSNQSAEAPRDAGRGAAKLAPDQR